MSSYHATVRPNDLGVTTKYISDERVPFGVVFHTLVDWVVVGYEDAVDMPDHASRQPREGNYPAISGAV